MKFFMITPSYLKPGEKIGIVSTARKVSPGEIEAGLECLKSWELVPVLGANVFKEYHAFAGEDADRALDMQKMLDDPEIRAILCTRGGYGTVRIIDKLTFRHFREDPKWIAGFSDVTVLHSHITGNLGIETIHSVMLYNFFHNQLTPESTESLRKALFGEKLSYEYEAQGLCRKGKGNGEICGGNLSMLYSLSGTPSDIDTDGKILFIEDLDEYLYHIDRMMQNLKRGGKLSLLAGLIVGDMIEMKDNKVAFGKTAEEIISETIAAFPYPVAFGFPAGHSGDNRAIIMGRNAELVVSERVVLRFK
jgi:muramoyltetrapeptide carboxypeptidase